SRTTLRLRVGSDESKRPIFAVWPMRMHRPLPPNSLIKTASVKREKIGPRDRWTLQITVDMTETKIVAPKPTIGGAVAIDIGWRLLKMQTDTQTQSEMPTASTDVTAVSDEDSRPADGSDNPSWQPQDALRVASYGDDSGNQGELRLDARLLSALKYADRLRGIRDTAFGVALQQLVSFLRVARDLPPWLKE